MADAAPIILYGAGTTGRFVLERLRRAGRDAAAFADDTPGKEGTSVDGVPVMMPRDAAERFGSSGVFVVTILNPALRFVDARARLRAITPGRVISFLELAREHPAHFLPYYQFEPREEVLRKRDDIARAAEVFADDESRRQLEAHVRFRIDLDFDALPANSKDDYFPDLLPPLEDDCVFVDCGAYDGDSVCRFLEVTRGRFGAIHAFEPDASNCARLRDYVATVGSEDIHVHCAAVGDRRGTLRFHTTGNMSASLSSSGAAEVDVVRVDEVVPATRAQTYVKYDVEGGEWEALRGTERLLRETRPLLAVSVYHRPDDLWQLPLYLHGLGLGYRLYLRTQGEDGMDVICYAI